MFVPDPLAMMDDGKERPGAYVELIRRLEQGVRFRRVPEINHFYWDLIRGCSAQSLLSRLTFEAICQGVIANVDRFLFQGGDAASVRRYLAKMKRYR
jgi:hypothetical protein